MSLWQRKITEVRECKSINAIQDDLGVKKAKSFHVFADFHLIISQSQYKFIPPTLCRLSQQQDFHNLTKNILNIIQTSPETF